MVVGMGGGWDEEGGGGGGGWRYIKVLYVFFTC